MGENQTYGYQYNADGLRTKKTNADGSYIVYHIAGGRYLGEIYYTATGAVDLYIRYNYDENGSVVGISLWNAGGSAWTDYYFEKNLQGDILNVYQDSDSLPTLVASYTYDAWGNILTSTGSATFDGRLVKDLNPFRYRGYYYDAETEFYYLQSRYYDPAIGRFINADGVIAGIGSSIQGYNVFAYCFNNPVNMSDLSGNWPKWIETAANWVNNNIIQPVTNLVDTLTSAITKSNITMSESNSLPVTGEPDSSQTLNNPDGTPKQKRWYGPDGKAKRDRDFNHQGSGPFPHDHDWVNGKRGIDHLPPSPEFDFSSDPIVGLGLVTICSVGFAVVALDDVTGIGVGDDFLLGPLGVGVSKGLIMIFG